MNPCARLGVIACLLAACSGGLGAQSSVVSLDLQSPAHAFTISGRAIDAEGRSLENLTMVIGADANGGFISETSEVAPADDGTFHTGRLASGRYVLEVFTPPDSFDNPASSAVGFVAVTVKDADVTGVTITTRRPVSLTGSVRFESDRDVEAPHPTVTIQAMLAMDGLRENHVMFARASDDGRFELSGIHGPRLIRADIERRNAPPWWLKAVLLDGVDVTNVPVDFAAKPHGRLEVVFADRPTAIVGLVNDEAGLPVEGAQVLVFPKDESLWATWSTAVHAGSTDENGRFWFVDAIPPGDYQAIALRAGTYPSDAAALDDLERLDRLATPFVVLENRVARIELTVNRAR
jgi:hypothetical protein